MARRGSSYEDTRTDCNDSKLPAQAVPVLIVVGDALRLGATRTIIRIDGSLQIGRAPDAPPERSWVVDDDRVSRKHAVLDADPRTGRAQLIDLGSRNGTSVNGRPIGTEAHPLVTGSIIFVGTYAAIFRYVAETDLEIITQDLATPFTPVATTSPGLARRVGLLRHLAKVDDDLLIIGETGVGKEEFARAIHRLSGRWGKFVAINCAALPGTLIESELFGYVKGAHSQASRDKLGLIDEAEHGTLFLDEFAEISLDVQAKLLRFLENKDMQALGSTKSRRIDTRILAATNRDMAALRQDIAARLGPEPIRLPPLRDRREDIGALAGYFLRDRDGMGLEVPAFQAICLHDWPDNVRGLRKALTRGADLAAAQGSNLIGLPHLPEDSQGKARPFVSGSTASESGEVSRSGRRKPRAAPTKEELEALLARHDWVVAQAARELDRDHAIVWRWIKRYGLEARKAQSGG
jgi:sigma-54 dependent transcriptional regulator, acetoin dehydrogenase operon transcriptional activator AcoR